MRTSLPESQIKKIRDAELAKIIEAAKAAARKNAVIDNNAVEQARAEAVKQKTEAAIADAIKNAAGNQTAVEEARAKAVQEKTEAAIANITANADEAMVNEYQHLFNDIHDAQKASHANHTFVSKIASSVGKFRTLWKDIHLKAQVNPFAIDSAQKAINQELTTVEIDKLKTGKTYHDLVEKAKAAAIQNVTDTALEIARSNITLVAQAQRAGCLEQENSFWKSVAMSPSKASNFTDTYTVALKNISEYCKDSISHQLLLNLNERGYTKPCENFNSEDNGYNNPLQLKIHAYCTLLAPVAGEASESETSLT